MTSGVYVLKNSATNKVGYVGISMNIESRMKQHKRNPHNKKLEKFIDSAGENLVVEIAIETSDLDKQCEIERKLIEAHRDTICNVTKGGMSGATREPVDQVSCRVPVEVADYLQKMAEEQERSLSWIVAKILRSYVEESKK